MFRPALVRNEPVAESRVDSGMKPSVKTTKSESGELRFARPIHPEDLSVGDAVLVSEIQLEYPTFLWVSADAATLPPAQPVRLSFLACPQQYPLTIRGICLPYLWCEYGENKSCLLDTRQIHLRKLDSGFAAAVSKGLLDNETSSESRRKKKKKKRKQGDKSRKKKRK